jgi:hypothetical protein
MVGIIFIEDKNIIDKYTTNNTVNKCQKLFHQSVEIVYL